MTLIKHANAKNLARDAMVLDLGDLARQGQALVERAKKDAERIVAEARAERERIMAGAAEQGFKKGYDEGLAKGLKDGEEKGRVSAVSSAKQQIEQTTGSWTRALAEFDAERDRSLRQLHDDVLRLALLIATRVTKRVIQTDPGVAAAQLCKVMETIARPTRLVVSIHPDDRQSLESALPGLLRAFPMVKEAELVADECISRGSIVTRSRGQQGLGGNGGVGGGEIDATIATQLTRIVEALVPGAGAATADLASLAGEAESLASRTNGAPAGEAQ